MDASVVPFNGARGRGAPVTHRAYDWERDCVGTESALPATEIILVEGLYAMHSRLRSAYDFCIWVDSRADDRMARCEARMHEQGLTEADRVHWLALWRELFVPREQRYIVTQRPADHADVLVLGASLSGTHGSFARELQ